MSCGSGSVCISNLYCGPLSAVSALPALLHRHRTLQLPCQIQVYSVAPCPHQAPCPRYFTDTIPCNFPVRYRYTQAPCPRYFTDTIPCNFPDTGILCGALPPLLHRHHTLQLSCQIQVPFRENIPLFPLNSPIRIRMRLYSVFVYPDVKTAHQILKRSIKES
jgi:hypothetical protein